MNAATLADPAPARNPEAQAAPALHPTTLERAEAMLEWLRTVPPAAGHEEARAAVAACACYLREVFGHQHAVAVLADIVGPIVEAGEVAPPPAEAPAVTLH